MKGEVEQVVFVLDKHKKPLGFATEKRARQLMDARRACIYRYFDIRTTKGELITANSKFCKVLQHNSGYQFAVKRMDA